MPTVRAALVQQKWAGDKDSMIKNAVSALRDAAAWVGCDNLSFGEVAPARLEQRMRTEIAAVS